MTMANIVPECEKAPAVPMKGASPANPEAVLTWTAPLEDRSIA